MSLFTPPRPVTAPEKRSSLTQRIALLRSGLGTFREGSYGARLGRHSFRTLPFLKKRWFFIVRDPELVREVLVKRAADFPKADLMDAMLRSLTGYSIFVSNGDVWGRQRRLVGPALEQARVRDVFARMLEAATVATARMETMADTGEPVRVDMEMTRFAADVIFRTIFSEPISDAAADRVIAAFEVFQGVAYAHGMLGLAKAPSRILPGWGRARRAARIIRKAIDEPLRRRLADHAAGRPTPDNDILAALIGGVDPVTGTSFDGDELLDQIAMLFLAGHETSASALAWSLYLMAEAPEVQARVQAEADAVLGDDTPAFEHMKRLGLTRDVFREAMRLYPPVAFLARDCPAGDRLGQKDIPAGSVVMVSPWLNHRQAERWPEPHAFDPDRFGCPEGKAAMAGGYFPFSVGPRVCPGAAFALQEAVLVLAMLNRRLRFEADPAWTPVPVARLTLRSANGVRLRVFRRGGG
ncbi:MAG: cytochrome P450 [Brevundimonas sp.]